MKKLLFSLSGVILAVSTCAEELEEVHVTATRADANWIDITGNAASVSGEDLALIKHTHITEALYRVTGTWISRGNGQEHLTAIRSPVFTGAGACGEFLYLEDGLPIRAAGFCNVNELFEINTEQAGRIEVVRGPGSALYGSNAIHGMINVLTEAPAETPEYRLGLEGGPHDYWRISASASNTFGTHGVRLSVNGTHDGGFQDDSGFGQQKLTLRHDYTIGNNRFHTLLSATNLNQETAGFIRGFRAFADSDIRRMNFNPEAFRDAKAIRISTRWIHALSDEKEFEITPYFRYTDMDFLQHFLPGKPLEENGQRSGGIQTAWRQTLRGKHQFIVGSDLEFTDSFLRQSQDGPTIGSAFLVATRPSGKHYDYDVNAFSISLYGHGDWQLSEKWFLTTGLRFEHINYDYDNKLLDGNTRDDGTVCGFGGCLYTRPADREDSFSEWRPNFGLRYAFFPEHSLWLNLSRGFRAPQATELYRLQSQQNIAELDSEQLDSIELGVRCKISLVRYEIAAFYMKKDNFIFRDSDGFNVDNGKTKHAGIEFGAFWQLGERFDLNMNFTFAKHEYDFSEGSILTGNDIDTAPRDLGSVVLGWEPLENTRAELEWVHIGEYFLDPANANEYEGHDLLHLRVNSQIHKNLNLHARITNLIDEDYAERGDFAFGSFRYFPGEPRSLYLGLEFLLD